MRKLTLGTDHAIALEWPTHVDHNSNNTQWFTLYILINVTIIIAKTPDCHIERPSQSFRIPQAYRKLHYTVQTAHFAGNARVPINIYAPIIIVKLANYAHYFWHTKSTIFILSTYRTLSLVSSNTKCGSVKKLR